MIEGRILTHYLKRVLHSKLARLWLKNGMRNFNTTLEISSIEIPPALPKILNPVLLKEEKYPYLLKEGQDQTWVEFESRKFHIEWNFESR